MTHPTGTQGSASDAWFFVGAGNMARAIAGGGLAGGVISSGSVAAYDPGCPALTEIQAVYGQLDAAEAWLASHPEAGIVLAVKPQMLPEVGLVWRDVLARIGSRLVVSILAGARASDISAALGENARVVRVMPNTPIRIGQGMSGMCLGPGASEGDAARTERLFAAGGQVIRIDEAHMDAFTALAGSGPAYVFYLAEAMVLAGQQLGFDRAQALQIVRQTVCGSGALLLGSEEPPEALRAAVTSKGGTTAAGTGVLDEHGVLEAVVAAVHAAQRRGVELAGG